MQKGSDATTKDAGRQWNDDEGRDLKARFLENLHDLDADEAEARAGYAELDESDNPYYGTVARAIVRFNSKQERMHQDLLHFIADSVEDGKEPKLNIDAVRKQTNMLLDCLEAECKGDKKMNKLSEDADDLGEGDDAGKSRKSRDNPEDGFVIALQLGE
ncbi:MAG: hypothetical protein ACK5MU_04050 [Candidatus Saccharimonadales bacterium]